MLKKIIALSLCSILLFTGCVFNKPKESASPDLNRLFSCNAEIRYGDFEMSAVLKRLGDGMWEAECSAPKTLAGVKLSYNGDDITASFKGLSFSIPKTAAPVKSIFQLAFSVIDKTAAGGELPMIEKDGVLIFSGEAEQGKFEVRTDKETGNLLGFSMPAYELEITCSDFEAIS